MKREQITIRLPAELKAALEKEAAKKGISFNALILILIDKARQNLRQ